MLVTWNMKHFDEIKETIERFWKKNKDGVVIIWGATATGKTWLSVRLSDFFDFEVISSDSRQIFRKMNVGTDKISEEIRAKLPHHQIDIIDPDGHYTAWQRQSDTKKIINWLHSMWKKAMIVGWTWLYIDSIYKNFGMPDCPPDYELRNELYATEEKEAGSLHKELERVDPESAAVNHPNSTRYIVRALEIYRKTWRPKSEICKEQPVEWPLLMIGLRRDKESTNKLIDQRIQQMVDGGLLEEVTSLLEQGYDAWLQSMQGIWYKETVRYIEWVTTKEEWISELEMATHRLAKKQRSRFRRYIEEWKNNQKDNVQYEVFEL